MRLRPECKNGGSSPFQSWDIETQKLGPKKKHLLTFSSAEHQKQYALQKQKKKWAITYNLWTPLFWNALFCNPLSVFVVWKTWKYKVQQKRGWNKTLCSWVNSSVSLVFMLYDLDSKRSKLKVLWEIWEEIWNPLCVRTLCERKRNRES